MKNVLVGDTNWRIIILKMIFKGMRVHKLTRWLSVDREGKGQGTLLLNFVTHNVLGSEDEEEPVKETDK